MKLRTHLVSFLVTAALLVAFSAHSSQAIEDSKRADLQTFFDLMGISRIGDAVAPQLASVVVQSERQQHPNASQQYLQIVQQEFSSALKASLADPKFLEQIKDVYGTLFSDDEIKELIRFYKSPLGQKTISVMPQAMQQINQIALQRGQAVGATVSERIRARCKAEGVQVPEEGTNSKR